MTDPLSTLLHDAQSQEPKKRSRVVVNSSVTASCVNTSKMKTQRIIPIVKCFDYNCHSHQHQHHHHQATRRSCTHYEGIWMNGDIIPLIRNLSSGWTLVVSFLYQLLEAQRNCPWYPLNRGLGGSQSKAVYFEEGKYLLPLLGIKPRSLHCKAHSLVAIQIMPFKPMGKSFTSYINYMNTIIV